MKRVNVRFLFAFLGAVAVLGGGIFALNRYQVDRNAGSLASLARQRLAEGKMAEAMGLFSRYLGMRPKDAAVHAEFAQLVLDRALAPDATQADLARAYNTLEEAVRRNPDNRSLRLKLAEFQLRIGRFVDAREHIDMLMAAAAEAPAGQQSDAEAATGEQDPPPDPVRLKVLLVQSYAGAGDFDTAARLAGELIAYDVTRREFDTSRQPADATEAYVALASILRQRFSDPASADAVLQELVKRRPKDPRAWLALAQWHRDTGNLAAAAKDIDKASELDGDNPDVVFGRFQIADARRDLATAEQVANQARELFPNDERVYRGLASLALQRNDLDAAEKFLREGVAALPNRASLLLMLANTLLQRGDLDEAEQTVGRVKELYGDQSPAVGLIEGRLLIARQRWPQARRKLEQIRPLAAGLGELSRQIDLSLGQCYEQLQEFDEQLDVNRRILVDDPSSVEARVGAAAALAAAGRPDEALQEFEAVAASIGAERLPGVPQVWYPLVQLRLLEQLKRPASDRDWSRLDALLASLEESTSVSAAQLTLLRADVLARKGEAESAIELLERATAAGDAGPQLWSALATMVLRERGVDAARAVLQKVPQADAGSPPILLAQAQVAASLPADQATGALEKLEASIDGLPADDAVRLSTAVASIRLQRGEQADGERLLRAAAARQPDDLRSRSALLDLAMQEGDVEKARAAAAEVRTVAGPTNARSLVAEAGVKILEVRKSQEKKELENGNVDLTPAERGLLDEARNLLIEAENERPGWFLIQRYFAEVDGLRSDIPSAIDRLQRALRLEPANPAIVRQLVGLLYATNRLDEARRALDSLGPDGIEGFERLNAEMELRAGKLDEAVALAERSVKAESANVGELLWLGQLLDRSGKTDRAGEVFARAVEAAPERPEAWLALFAHQIAIGKRRAAENTLDRAADQLTSPQRDLVLAQGYELLGRIEEADRAYRDAVAASPDDLTIGRGRAEFLVRHGRLGDARDVLQKLVAAPDSPSGVTPAKAWARRKLAELTAGRGTYADLAEAISMIGLNAVDGKLAGEDAALEISLLVNRPEPESWERAIDAIGKLEAVQPLSTGQRLARAGLLEKVGRWEECRDELLSIVSAPNVPPAYIGMLVEKMIEHGDVENARPWLKRLQSAAPGSPVALGLEARMAAATNDRKAAAEAARKLMPGPDMPPNQAGQLPAIARLMEDIGFPKAADQVLAKFAGLSADGVLARAEFLGRQKRIDEALDLLEKAWDQVPLERLLTAGVSAARAADSQSESLTRLDGWLTRGRRIDPESVTIPLLEAELRGLQGRETEVEAIYRRLLERKDLSPVQRAIVGNNLAFHLAKPATATEARSLIDSSISTLGPHPDLLDTRAMVMLSQGDDRGAVTDLERAVLQPSDVKYLHLAYAQFRTGETENARTSLAASRKKGLSIDRLSPVDRARLRELETALGVAPQAPKQAGVDEAPRPQG